MSNSSLSGGSRYAAPRPAAVLAATLLTAVTIALPVRAARYEARTPAISEVEAKQLVIDVSKVMRNAGALSAADQKVLDQYFKGWFFPVMTSTDAASLGNLAKSRKELFQRFINFTQSQAVRDYLIDTSIKECGRIAFGNFHPAVRYNAVLIIGGLDARNERGQPPVVSPAATQALLILAKNDEWKGNPIPSSVKVAALVGLQRHARFGVEEKYREEMTETALAVINREEIPDDVTRSVYDWMRVQAAEVLAYQYAQGPTPDVAAALASLIGDDEIKLAERCRVATHLERMKLPADGEQTVPLATALAKLAKAVFKEERQAAEEFQEELLDEQGFSGGIGGGIGGGREFGGGYGGGEFGGGYGGREFGGGYGGDLGVMEETGPRYEKRRMLARILAVLTGLRSVESSASEELKPKLRELGDPIGDLAKKATERSITDLDVAMAVIGTAKTVDAAVASFNAPAAGEVDDADAEADAFQAAANP